MSFAFPKREEWNEDSIQLATHAKGSCTLAVLCNSVPLIRLIAKIVTYSLVECSAKLVTKIMIYIHPKSKDVIHMFSTFQS